MGGLDDWTLELKNRRGPESSLAAFMDRLQLEKRVEGRRFGAVIAKQRGRPTADAYVVTTLADWAAFVNETSPPAET